MWFIKSQQDFANATGLNRSIVSFLYLGKRNLTDKHIRLICEGFDFVNPEWLRTGEGEMFDKEPERPERSDKSTWAELYLSACMQIEEMKDLLTEKDLEIKKLRKMLFQYEKQNHESTE